MPSAGTSSLRYLPATRLAIGRNDQDFSYLTRPPHFHACFANRSPALLAQKGSTQVMVLLRQSPHAVLDDNHGRIYDESEVDCPKAHKIGGDAEVPHSDNGDEHG